MERPHPKAKQRKGRTNDLDGIGDDWLTIGE